MEKEVLENIQALVECQHQTHRVVCYMQQDGPHVMHQCSFCGAFRDVSVPAWTIPDGVGELMKTLRRGALRALGGA